MADSPNVHIVAEEPRPGFFSNVVAIIGFIILIVVVIWGLVHLASLSKGWLSGIFNRTSVPAIQVTAPASVDSGSNFTVSWRYSTTDRGNYALLYKCTNGLELKFSDAKIPCGAAYTIGSINSASLSTTLTGTSTSVLPLSVIFLPSATSSKQAQGSANIAVRLPSFVPSTQTVKTPTVKTPVITTGPILSPVKPAPTNTNTSTQTSNYNGPANIAVRIIAIGVIDQNGQFVNRPPMSPNEMVAAQFDIANLGGSSTGVYYFSAVLPTTSGYTYSSPAQSPLAPGDHVMNTLRWNQSSQSGAFSVTVTGGGNDANNADNYASQWLGQNYYTPQTNYYPQYQY